MTTKQTMTGHWSTRPHFSARQFLTADQLNTGLDDELWRQRLLNRAVLGHGVVFGFGIHTDDEQGDDLKGCLELTCGLAIDRHGRMLYWPGGRIGPGDIVGQQPECEGCYTLSVHYAERLPDNDKCTPPGAGDSHWRYQGVVFTLSPTGDAVDRCCDEHPDGACIDHEEYLWQRTGALAGGSVDALPASPDLEWVCRKPGTLCPTHCGTWTYDPDPDVAVPLACVEICDLTTASQQEQTEQQEHGSYRQDPPSRPACKPEYGFCGWSDAALEVRPIVYRNPLLYELLNCCDVEAARVDDVSWRDWVTSDWDDPVPWTKFAERIDPEHDEGLQIRFTRPIKTSTLHDGSVQVTATFKESRTDYWMAQLVPLAEILPIDASDGLARGVRLVPEHDWFATEVDSSGSTLYGEFGRRDDQRPREKWGPRFEVTLRGQLLRDDCGQMLDALPLDFDSCSRCQHRPGDDFVSVFHVAHPDQAE